MSRVQEENRVLTWYFKMKDGTRRDVRAPLLDATPSTAPCIEGQNLVQNGDLESIADHARWQQSGTTNLLVNDPPPGLATGRQWATACNLIWLTPSAASRSWPRRWSGPTPNSLVGTGFPLQVTIEQWPGIDTPVDLVFRTQTDWAFPTDFTIDTLRLVTHC
ncbi:MAG: hypothetical protein KF832_12805 [Caldilineaceae bacterium]|nr:hypothetical protein [Caldilineaceae bacterium]